MNHDLSVEEKIKRDDRVRYYVIKLKNIVSKNELFELIEKNGITSKSTAKRVANSVFDWGKGEIELFLATYTPVRSDSKSIEKILELNASKVSSEVIEVDKCTECGTESAYTIYELAAKNQELQKELQKYKNDLNIVLDDRRKLECLLSDNANAIELNPKYDSLYKVLLAAYNQASNGKGKERHQLNNEEYFEDQKICEIARRLSIDYNLGQAVKKIYESKRLTDGRDIAELYGAINYIAAAIIVKQEE